MSLDQVLINGELRSWYGQYAPVLSPVCVQRAGQGGELEPLVIGQTPLMGE